MSARVLILGGGGFLGFHAVGEALAAGHQVSVFSRSGKAPVPGVEVITGDRQGDLDGLRGRQWDAVFDTFNDPADGAPAIAATARLLSGSVGSYGYVSGMSVYAPSGPAVPDETAPVRARGVEPDTDRLQARSLAKLAGEAAVGEHFDGVALFPRVGIMVGPRSDRFSWWPARFAAALAGEDGFSRRVVVPGDPQRSVQYSDARDIARWSIEMLISERGGTFNTVGPGRPDTLLDVLHGCLRAAGGNAAEIDLVTAADEDALRAQLASVDEEERPLWYPEEQIPQRAIDSSAAVAAGLTFRSAEQTAADILAWMSDSGSRPLLERFAGQERLILERLDG